MEARSPCIYSWLGCLLSILFAAIVLPANATATPQAFDSIKDSPFYHVAWGPYTVSVEKTGKNAVTANRCWISNHAGRVLKEINAAYILSVDYPDLAGHGHGEELCIVTAPYSNLLAKIRTYCFTRHDGLRNILAVPGQFDQASDLGEDGQEELISDDHAPLEYVADLCHTCSPPVWLALRWDGRRYTVANRRFPAAVWMEVRHKEKLLAADLVRFQDPQNEFPSKEEIVGQALGIWADLASIGQSRTARLWLLARLPPEPARSFLEGVPEVAERLARVPAQLTTDQSRVIYAPE